MLALKMTFTFPHISKLILVLSLCQNQLKPTEKLCVEEKNPNMYHSLLLV